MGRRQRLFTSVRHEEPSHVASMTYCLPRPRSDLVCKQAGSAQSSPATSGVGQSLGLSLTNSLLSVPLGQWGWDVPLTPICSAVLLTNRHSCYDMLHGGSHAFAAGAQEDMGLRSGFWCQASYCALEQSIDFRSALNYCVEVRFVGQLFRRGSSWQEC